MNADRNDVRRLISAFASAMKAHGFAKRGSSIWREKVESRDLITFSAIVDKESGGLDIAIDYAVFLKAFDTFYRNDLDLMKSAPLNGEFVKRLGARQGDSHWHLAHSNDVDALATTLVGLAKDEMLPFLEARNTIKKSLALLMPDLNDNSLHGSVAVKTMILAHLCNEPSVFCHALMRAREKLGTTNPAFLNKAERFVEGLHT